MSDEAVLGVAPAPAVRTAHMICCTGCGAVMDSTDLVHELQEQIQALREENFRLTRRAKDLRKQGYKQLHLHERYDEAMEVLEHWRSVCQPTAKALRGERLRKVLDRLEEGCAVAELQECADGYGAYPFLVNAVRVAQGTPQQWNADAELVFRDDKHVRKGLLLAQQAQMRAAAIPRIAPSTPPPAEETLGEMGQAAVRLARFGWLVFPIAPRGKTPVTSNGLLDATGDVARVVGFWSVHPDHNVAVRCGAESDVVVLDVDGELGHDSLAELEIRYGSLPSTVSVKTPRGGSHYYFRHPGVDLRNTAGYPGPGLDVRGDGGYVLCPPSIGPMGNRYELDAAVPIVAMPDWLLDLLMRRQRATGGRVDPAEWEAMVAKGVSSGQRNQQLVRLTGYLWSHGLAPGVIQGLIANVNRERCTPPLGEEEVRRIVSSVARMRQRQEERAGG